MTSVQWLAHYRSAKQKEKEERQFIKDLVISAAQGILDNLTEAILASAEINAGIIAPDKYKIYAQYKKDHAKDNSKPEISDEDAMKEFQGMLESGIIPKEINVVSAVDKSRVVRLKKIDKRSIGIIKG